MKLPVYWLKKYIDVYDNAADIASKLTLSGTAVERVESHNGYDVLDIEVTTNRPDCLSIVGLAKEWSALTGAKLQLPKLEKISQKSLKAKNFSVKTQVKACSVYGAKLIRDCSIKASDVDTQLCLQLCSSKSISNAVDVTNFVMFELGQPLHVFDFDKIEGSRIVVRFAVKGEKLLALDGMTYELDEKTLVIADAKKPIAIAGVIGGKDTEVTSQTKNILLESAYFDPVIVRSAIKKHKIKTESGYRFERNVNAQATRFASDRAADLITKMTGGHFVEEAWVSTDKPIKGTFNVYANKINDLLGTKISAARMKTILNALGFEVKLVGKTKLAIKRNTARLDVNCDADVAEEILRIEGFDKVEASIPMTRHQSMEGLDRKPVTLLRLKQHLASMGFSEIVTYSLLSKKALKDSALLSDPCIEPILNPLSAEQEIFRPSLFAGMMQSISHNLNHKNTDLQFFEIGNIYRDAKECTRLSVALCGLKENNWKQKTPASFYALKGAIENIALFLKTDKVTYDVPKSTDAFDYGCEVKAGLWTGHVSKVATSVLRAWDIATDVYYAEFDMDPLFNTHHAPELKVLPIAKYPSVYRDLAFLTDKRVACVDLENAMKSIAAPYLKNVTLFDEYVGKNIDASKRSLAFSLEYQKEDATFTDDEILKLQQSVIETLKSRFNVQVRS